LRLNRLTAIATTLLLTGTLAACAPESTPWRASPSTGPFAFEIPGTALAASLGDGEVVATSSGEGEPGAPLDADAAFHIGSMTKLFTAALVMQLDDEGVLSLDDTIDGWFPDAPNGGAITVRMLLQHESGLDELDFDLVGHVTPQELLDEVFTRAPVFAPGTEYEYLNAGYIMLGRIAELAAETPYAELVDTRFIEPLGLTSTYLDGAGTGPEAVDGFVLVCSAGEGADCAKQFGTVEHQEASPQWTGAWSAGAMVSSARDQALWIRALVGGDVVDERHLEQMRELTPLSSEFYAATYDAAGVPAVQLGEGAGLATWKVPGVGLCHGHAGAIPGSNGIAAYCPETELAVVILNAIEPAGLTPGYPGLTPLTAGALGALRR
jgi:D-alanyl-D-alanine carboxypeptidase